MVIIRKMRRRDIPKVSNLVVDVLKNVNSKDYSEEVIENLAELYSEENFRSLLKKRRCFVLVIDGVISGTVCIKEDKIYTLFVDKRYHGRGYGKMLMDFAEKKILKNGFNKIRLSASLTAYSFYKRIGYIKVGYDRDKNFGDVVIMEKSIV